MAGWLLRGSVMHHRLRPVQHRFRYAVFTLRLPLSALSDCANALFSINRWNLASFYYRDHGARDGSAPLDWIRQVLRDADIDCADGEVWLQCFPRLLGYVFNPVSFWFCEDRHAKLRAILVEVNNTFGESHAYLLAHADQRPIQDGELLEARKQFHVSPFFPVEGHYRFRFTQDKQPTRVRIDYRDMDGPLLNTAITGQAQALSAGAVWRAWVSHPLMTLAVVWRIHWQALQLWRKRVRFYRKPTPPNHPLSR